MATIIYILLVLIVALVFRGSYEIIKGYIEENQQTYHWDDKHSKFTELEQQRYMKFKSEQRMSRVLSDIDRRKRDGS